MKKYCYLFSILTSFYLCAGLPGTQRGVIVVPVADLVNQPLPAPALPLQGPDVFYRHIPLAPHHGDLSCPRIHQALFNELVTIHECRGTQLLISVDRTFYDTDEQPHQSKYWTLKKNVLSLSNMKRLNIDTATIPPDITWRTPASVGHNSDTTVTLLKPWYDGVTQRAYSAGTRFVLAQPHRPGQPYQVQFISPEKMATVTSSIPCKKGILYTPMSRADRIRLFVDILRSWIQKKQRTIAYVWGGCSYTAKYRPLPALQPIKKTISGHQVTFYDSPHIDENPKTGFDCAGLIWRAAQIAGIPFFCKNSLTIARRLVPLTPADTLEEGDIIWIPGHVMVVSNLANHLLIEARGYSHGYGCVHEIPLSTEFKDIHTYRDLRTAYEQQRPLKRLDKTGKVIQIIENFKLLKLSSVWNK